MSEIATIALSRPAASVPSTLTDKPKRFKIGPKLKIAIDAIVFDGADMQEAARIAKTSTRAIRKALERGHVVKHLYKRREVLRTHASAQNIKRLVEIRDAADNMPAVQAIRELEHMGDEQGQASRAAAPFSGLVVVINQPAAQGASVANPVQVIDNAGDEV